MILITGLTGTSGSAFYDVLCREKYDSKIRVVIRESTNLDMFKNSPLDLEFVVGDIHDKEFLKTALVGCDRVFHIAAKGCMVPIAEAVAESSGNIGVIFVSSTTIYSQYYRTSYLKEHEKHITKLFDEKNIRYVFIRPTMIFGTSKDKNISVFARWFRKFPIFPIVQKGSATIQPVSRKDLAEGYWLILKNFDSLQRKEYVFSGEKPMTLMEMFGIITKVIGKKTVFINIPFSLAKLAVDSIYWLSFKKIDYREKLDRLTEDRAYSHEAATEEFGYAPLSFEERLREYI